MLVIKIELWPRGNEAKKKLLHTISIYNDNSGTHARGNYCAWLTRKGSTTKTWKIGRVENFPRLRKNAYDLLYQVLHAVVGKRNSVAIKGVASLKKKSKAPKPLVWSSYDPEPVHGHTPTLATKIIADLYKNGKPIGKSNTNKK